MSQITRCPSCSTSFKVVADQLRISQGWVRCGQCKEVFDASAHLLAAAPPALLPEVSLTDLRPPPAPVARKADAARSWGDPPPSLSSSPQDAPSVEELPELPAAAGKAAFSLFPGAVAEATGGLLEAHTTAETPVLDVPGPAVPAFLSSSGGAVTSGEEPGTTRLAPFAWRPSAAPNTPAATGEGAMAGGDAVSPAPVVFSYVLTGEAEPPAVPQDGEDAALEPAATAALTPMGYPALELPAKPFASVEEAERGDGAAVALSAAEGVQEPLPPVDFVQQTVMPLHEPDGLALVEDHSPVAVLQASFRKASEARKVLDAVDEHEGADTGQEVSFVVAARRKAFWRKPMVRIVLGVLLVLSAAVLTVQVAVHERNRLAAMDARMRPWLLALCAPLRCELAPPRQIADVVIDSSSFNKARGDSYQLALTMKSKASMPLAMPAVELTLTDAQDQPVLRRVLLPTDMGAPMELPAGGEWSASVAVIVTTGGARVAGYRLLAFYP